MIVEMLETQNTVLLQERERARHGAVAKHTLAHTAVVLREQRGGSMVRVQVHFGPAVSTMTQTVV